jgi:hypothetical protein
VILNEDVVKQIIEILIENYDDYLCLWLVMYVMMHLYAYIYIYIYIYVCGFIRIYGDITV